MLTVVPPFASVAATNVDATRMTIPKPTNAVAAAGAGGGGGGGAPSAAEEAG